MQVSRVLDPVNPPQPVLMPGSGPAYHHHHHHHCTSAAPALPCTEIICLAEQSLPTALRRPPPSLHSTSTVLSLNMATMAGSVRLSQSCSCAHGLTRSLQTRNRDFAGGIPLNNTENDRSAYTWGNSIWNSKPVGSGFGSTPRDGSRPRGAYDIEKHGLSLGATF